jgi:small-conductance mechanosensitive channel
VIELLAPLAGVLLLVPAAAALAWCARRVIRALTRRAVRLAAQRPGSWRARSRRIDDVEVEVEARKRQRADAAARTLGHVVTALVFVAAALVGLHMVGVDPVYAISSAGFVGLAIALSGQELIKNLLAGTVALLEDRYAVGDTVSVRVSGNEVRGTIDLVGAASIRIRTDDDATWHAGHGTIESVTNFSQLPASADIAVATDAWHEVEEEAPQRLTNATNDVGLTGVVFLPELSAQAHPAGVTTVTVRTNRPLTDGQKCLVRDRLVPPPAE